jgi:DNA-binding NarL/FixJ family response regulator
MQEGIMTLQRRTSLHQLEKIDVWLVEDNDDFRSSIVELINETDSMKCERAFSSCEEAIACLQRDEVPEVVLMDIGLPGMNGVEGVKRVKTLSPSTDVIMLTVYDDDENVFRAICAGASGYLLKNAPADSILNAIGEVLKGGAPMNGAIARRVLEMFAKTSVPKSEYGLTPREKEILQLLVDGFTMKQIAEKLFVSYHTIDTHQKNIYVKLHVHSRSGAVAKALKENLL